MKRGVVGTLSVMLAVTVLCSCKKKEEPTPEPVQPTPTVEVKPAISFTMPSLQERDVKISMSDYEGKVVLLDFWATWCPPCRSELGDLAKLYEKLKDQGFVIIGMTLDQESWEKMSAKVAPFNLPYPVGAAVEVTKTLPQFSNVRSIPTKYLVSKTGQIVGGPIVGVVPPAELEKMIQPELAK